ncbi:hypothetical protein BD309DRAFT_1081994 [Dichomitus squalens]|nr:hypothetical protein BD309DRAFT_1081994 [Dichomitus squalens]
MSSISTQSPDPLGASYVNEDLNNPPVTSPSLEGFQRDSDIWFEDGNIIVIAQSTAFRFHKSVLASHSQVFRELFSVPQPSPNAGESEAIDGCTVMYVSDTGYDFRELLRAIYRGVSYLHPEQTISFPILAALARLGHKYQLDQLLDAVIFRLQRTFNTDLEVWDRSRGFGADSPLGLVPNNAIEALNLFRRLQRSDMIPTALCGCSRLPPAVLIHGVDRADGVTRESLELTDLELCWKVQKRLIREAVDQMTLFSEYFVTRLAEVKCQRRDYCIEGLKILLQETRRGMSYLAFVDPLDKFSSIFESDDARFSKRLCRDCLAVLKSRHWELRKKVWGKLPDIMGMSITGWGS